MKVYLAGTQTGEMAKLAARFGDLGVCPETDAGGERRTLLRRLALLSGCDAIRLPPDWRTDERAKIEKAVAAYLRIPEVSYFLPGAKGE